MRNASCPHCFRLIFGPVLTGLISLLDMRRRALGPDSVWLNLPFSPPEFQSISYGLFYGYWESKNMKFNRSNVRKFFLEMNSKRTASKFRKKKESCCLAFSSSAEQAYTKRREMSHFHVVVVRWRQRNVQKSGMHVQSYCTVYLSKRNCFFAVLVKLAVVVA